MIPVMECLTDITFTWHDGVRNKLFVFSITRMVPLIQKALGCEVIVIDMPLYPENREMYLTKMGVEKHRLDRLKEPFDPVIAVLHRTVEGDPRTHLTAVDGMHRIAKSYMLGRASIPAYIVPPVIWEKVLVDLSAWGIDMNNPSAEHVHFLLNGWSGIA